MKKVIYYEYGNAEVLQLAEVSQPEPDKSEVLVAVKSVSINPLDWKIFGGRNENDVRIKFSQRRRV